MPSNEKTPQHLMHLIVTRNGCTPNFSLLLGSGASSTSGIPTAENLIEEWRRLLFDRSDRDSTYDDWLSTQQWFNHEDEYSILFEQIYDQPSQRRVCVEECVKDAHPGWGYVYLTDLLAQRFFDVVFTTNFDDLLNEACYLYSDGLRPIVAAHDSAIQGIRVSSTRPKIVKLHGDFLYDNIKNTLAELETLETNTKRKLAQFAQEYGLVVLGYSGRDRSVMDTLELLLRDEENFKQGVYWCLRRGSARSARLEALLRKERVYLVEIDGFDEFAAELHSSARLTLPRAIARPLELARDRARLFTDIQEPLRFHPVIGGHVQEVLKGVSTHMPRLPLAFEAATLSSLGKVDEAIAKWEEAYREDTADPRIARGYAEALADAARYEELGSFATESPLSYIDKAYFLLRAGRNQEVIDLVTEASSDPASRGRMRQSGHEFALINRPIAFKRLGCFEEMTADLDRLERNGFAAFPPIRAGISALRGDKQEMFAALREALNVSLSSRELMVFPVFEDYREDPEFLEFATPSTEA